MTYVPTKEIKIKERQDKFLKAQLEKEREQALLEEIEKTEKERVKKKGTVQQHILNEKLTFPSFHSHPPVFVVTHTVLYSFVSICRFESFEAEWHPGRLPRPPGQPVQIWPSDGGSV